VAAHGRLMHCSRVAGIERLRHGRRQASAPAADASRRMGWLPPVGDIGIRSAWSAKSLAYLKRAESPNNLAVTSGGHGGIGRRSGLKIRRSQDCGGSSPPAPISERPVVAGMDKPATQCERPSSLGWRGQEPPQCPDREALGWVGRWTGSGRASRGILMMLLHEGCDVISVGRTTGRPRGRQLFGIHLITSPFGVSW
jgi:hypothetical protein